MLLKDGRYVDIQDRDDFSRLILDELGEEAQRFFLTFVFAEGDMPGKIAELVQTAAEDALDYAAHSIANRVDRELRRFHCS